MFSKSIVNSAFLNVSNNYFRLEVEVKDTRTAKVHPNRPVRSVVISALLVEVVGAEVIFTATKENKEGRETPKTGILQHQPSGLRMLE